MGGDANTHSSYTGSTACAADTETLLGGAAVQLPSNGQMTIHKIKVNGGNEVDAKASTMIVELKISGLSGPFKFPCFSGQGASASQGGMLKDEIDVSITVASGARVNVYVTASEAHALVSAGLEWTYGGGGKQTYGDVLGPTDAGAAARVRMGGTTGKITINSGGGYTITELRAALGNVVDDTETQGKLEVVASGLSEQDYAVGAGFGAATNGTTIPCDKIKVRLAVSGNAEIQLYLTMQEATVDNIVGIVYS